MYEATQSWAIIKDDKPKRDIFHVISDLTESQMADRVVWLFVGVCAYTAGVLAIL